MQRCRDSEIFWPRRSGSIASQPLELSGSLLSMQSTGRGSGSCQTQPAVDKAHSIDWRTAAGEPAPEGFPQGLPAPEALSAAAAKDSGEMIEAYGEYTARCFHSKTWQLREAALQRMQQSITPQVPHQMPLPRALHLHY